MDGSAREAVAISAGDAGFTDFYIRHYRDVVAVAVALTGDRWVAEDLAQEAFARALRRWGQVSGYERADAWVKRVAANLCVSRWRRLGAEARALARVAGRLDREESVAMPDEAGVFWEEVRMLPAAQRQTVTLRYVADLSVAEIAAAMGCPEGTVKSHLHRARKRLAERFEALEVTA